MNDVSAQLNRAYQEKVVKTLLDSIKKVALTIDASLVKMTPIDTGRARANWLPSINTPAGGTLPAPQSNKPPMAPHLTGLKLSDTIFITNNLPYIKALDEGHSQQAPRGFTRASIDKGLRSLK